MNKKGQGLQVNWVIIALLALVFLLFVSLFFFGGAKWIKETLFGMGAERMKGTDITLAQHQCELYCDYAKTLTGDTAIRNSAYCTTKFDIKKNGEVEEKKCKDIISCSGVDNNCDASAAVIP